MNKRSRRNNLAIRVFTIPLMNPEPAQAELNGFLRSHKVISIERRWIDQGMNSAWTFCVDYLETLSGGGPSSGSATSRTKVDYREILSPADFALFAKLRDLRKQLAAMNAVPVYAVFTNEQLARMVQDRATSKAALEQIAGVGDARIDKYGEQFLELLRSAGTGPDEANGKPV